jgi:hypothetical protein
MARSIEDLTLVSTDQRTYLGYAYRQPEGLRIEDAAIVTVTGDDPKELAYQYFAEKAKRKLQDVTVPSSAVESLITQPAATILYRSYEELAKAAARPYAGKTKIKRLERLLGGENHG